MPASDTSDREIIITRVVDAPRTLVWKAWTQPEHLEKWWGPDGFSVTTRSIQVREGGLWDFVMHGPDGRDYENRIIFTKITEPERIDHDHGDGEGKINFKATITFEAQGDKTLITMHTVFPTAQLRDYVVKEHGAIEGGKQTLGRMAAYAKSM